MYCLAASNMAIHGDGKTNIYPESGLDAKIIAEIKNGIKDPKTNKIYKPTIGLLNPPYKADKKNDVEELEFVKWNLEALVEGGTCVAIVPMQCAIAGEKKKKIYALKKELLQKHTLEAVFSMPDELFYNSDKSVVTCIMVFTAHKPHPKGKETFFGYFKDDGFEKRKNLGRIDAHNKWSKIKEEWLYLYRNKKEVVGKSVMHSVTAKDEWCAEVYMETLYSSIQKSLFEDTIRNYINYEIFFNRIASCWKNVATNHN
jgi:type I restriction-modification system DNA methylase subunit